MPGTGILLGAPFRSIAKYIYIYIDYRLILSRDSEKITDGGQGQKKKKKKENHIGHIPGCYLVSSTRYSVKRNVNVHAGCCGQLPIMPAHTPRLCAGEVAVEYQHTAQIPCICFWPSYSRLHQGQEVWQTGGGDPVVINIFSCP